jgi:hypothetical protein
MNIRKGDWVVEKWSFHTRNRPLEQGRVVRFMMAHYGPVGLWLAVVRIGKDTDLFCVRQLRVVRRKA